MSQCGIVANDAMPASAATAGRKEAQNADKQATNGSRRGRRLSTQGVRYSPGVGPGMGGAAGCVVETGCATVRAADGSGKRGECVYVRAVVGQWQVGLMNDLRWWSKQRPAG